MKPREKGHSLSGLGASRLSGVGGVGGVSFLIGEDTGFLVVYCVSLTIVARCDCSGCGNVVELED